MKIFERIRRRAEGPPGNEEDAGCRSVRLALGGASSALAPGSHYDWRNDLRTSPYLGPIVDVIVGTITLGPVGGFASAILGSVTGLWVRERT